MLTDMDEFAVQAFFVGILVLAGLGLTALLSATAYGLYFVVTHLAWVG